MPRTNFNRDTAFASSSDRAAAPGVAALKLESAWRRLVVVGLVLGFGSCAGCQVDEFANPQRMSCDKCIQRGGRCVGDSGNFCVLPNLSRDAGFDREDSGTEPKTHERCSGDVSDISCYDGDPRTMRQAPCQPGIRTCDEGAWSECQNQVLPKAEQCNGQDDDCDGATDEVPIANCSVTDEQGVCRSGRSQCLRGLAHCVAVSQPSREICNGEDDDCDGTVDEATAECYEALDGCHLTSDGTYDCDGICSPGIRACNMSGDTPECQHSVTPRAELCTKPGEQVRDEDCDGQYDESCDCSEGATCYTGWPPDTQNRMPCRVGVLRCGDAGVGDCVNEITPEPESCANEGSDDDCDGIADNVPIRGASCAEESDAIGACKERATWRCQDGKQVCVPAERGVEVCDGSSGDEDCDGTGDESFALNADPDNCGACGVQCPSGLACCNGACVNTDSANSHCGGCMMPCGEGADTCCGGVCRDVQNDKFNCGLCGNNCTLLGLLGSCVGGRCKL